MTATSTPVPHGRRGPVRAAVLGGSLWAPYGVLELVEPWGPDTKYDEALGHDVVVDPALFWLYSAPGSLAVVLCAVGLLELVQRLAPGSRGARLCGWASLVLGAVSACGVVLRFDPAFTGARTAAILVLGVGGLLAARSAPPASRTALLVLGCSGVGLIVVWPLVFAVAWLPRAGGATLLAAHGLLWVWAASRRSSTLPARRSGATIPV